MIETEDAERAALGLARWPIVSSWLRRRYESRFAANRNANLFRGVYASFAEAQASAPPGLPLGYDNPASAAMYLDRTRRTYSTDYPVMFWLQMLFAGEVARVFDLGGHVGVSYYAYRRYLHYPKALHWCVHDVPAVMAQGRKLASERDPEQRLDFAETFARADGFDVLVAQGSVQYLPETLPPMLERLAAPPRHVIVNLMPLHERDAYYTLQSVGTAFCPYRVESQGAFLKAFDSLGYALVDTWDNPDKKCEIPFHPERSLDRYHGFYFRRPS